jgi:hypothetical protein
MLAGTALILVAATILSIPLPDGELQREPQRLNRSTLFLWLGEHDLRMLFSLDRDQHGFLVFRHR